MVDNIFREPTPEESKDMTNILKRKKKDKFELEVLEEEKSMMYTKKPFCRRCALLDYKDYKENLKKELSRGSKPTIKIPEIEDYKDSSRFQLVGESKKDFSYYKGGPSHTTVYKDYRCKKRGCGISIQENVTPKGKTGELVKPKNKKQ